MMLIKYRERQKADREGRCSLNRRMEQRQKLWEISDCASGTRNSFLNFWADAKQKHGRKHHGRPDNL